MEGVVVSPDAGEVPEHPTLSRDVIMAISDFVEAFPTDPGTAQPNPGIVQSNSETSLY
jgi:hypothetical protein